MLSNKLFSGDLAPLVKVSRVLILIRYKCLRKVWEVNKLQRERERKSMKSPEKLIRDL